MTEEERWEKIRAEVVREHRMIAEEKWKAVKEDVFGKILGIVLMYVGFFVLWGVIELLYMPEFWQVLGAILQGLGSLLYPFLGIPIIIGGWLFIGYVSHSEGNAAVGWLSLAAVAGLVILMDKLITWWSYH